VPIFRLACDDPEQCPDVTDFHRFTGLLLLSLEKALPVFVRCVFLYAYGHRTILAECRFYQSFNYFRLGNISANPSLPNEVSEVVPVV